MEYKMVSNCDKEELLRELEKLSKRGWCVVGMASHYSCQTFFDVLLCRDAGKVVKDATN